ncbi:MAG: adenylate/guanylate cyclase domain-containing protein [Bacteroidota bacterium]
MPSRQNEYKNLIENIILISLFVGGANFFIFLKMSGVEDPLLVFGEKVPFASYLDLHLRVSLGGALIGSLILLYETYVHPRVTKNFSSLFLRRFIWQVDVAVIILLPIFLLNTIFAMLGNGLPLQEAIRESFSFLTTPLFLSFFIYYYFLSILVSFLRRLHKSFGQHVFYNYLIGKYREPLEEKRTFLFLDLNDSTRIAEELGHVKYSRFLNRCFDDIIQAVAAYEYDIYQFVGDEVVFTWPASQDDRGKAIHMYLDVKQKLFQLRDLYEQKFGLRPFFKAAVSTGNVSATLVGGKSKNIAYHGDVLNTTARLLGLCKTYGKEILFTQFYLKSQGPQPSFAHEFVASIKLKGKANTSNVYSIT